MSSSQTLSQTAASRAARYACAVLVITSIHHAYGAYVYNTPWRYHAILVAGVTAPLILGALAVVRARPLGLLRALAQGLFILATLGVAVLMIGMFEGLYNHVVKDLLYFGGASSALMTRLFPPPTYELPNDAFFEITGILQVVPAALAAWYPEKRLYKEFAVEESSRALLDPRAWLPIIRAVVNSARDVIRERRPVPPVRPQGGSLGLPGDFLIATDGRVLACKYGVHADDQWSVDELLRLVRSLHNSSDALATHVGAA